jgi:hypothetical protein
MVQNNIVIEDGELKGVPYFPCCAWGNFDGTTADNVSGTYSRTGTTVTVTLTGHGHKVGHRIYADFTSGAAVDGEFTVTDVTDADTFTFEHGTSGSTSGNITLNRRALREGGNISNVSYLAVGTFAINYTEPMPDTNYSYSILWDIGSASADARWVNNIRNITTSSITYSTRFSAAAQNGPNNTVLIFR